MFLSRNKPPNCITDTESTHEMLPEIDPILRFNLDKIFKLWEIIRICVCYLLTCCIPPHHRFSLGSKLVHHLKFIGVM